MDSRREFTREKHDRRRNVPSWTLVCAPECRLSCSVSLRLPVSIKHTVSSCVFLCQTSYQIQYVPTTLDLYLVVKFINGNCILQGAENTLLVAYNVFKTLCGGLTVKAHSLFISEPMSVALL